MDADALNREASMWMKRGMALLEPGTRADLLEAVGHFDRAIELRRTLPLDTVPMHRYGLAAGWLNRGDALTRLGGGNELLAAVAAFDEGLAVLADLPLDDDPRVRRRVAIAWQNRGLARQAQGDAALPDARASLERAIALLEHPRASALRDRTTMLAAVWANLANACIRDPSSDLVIAARQGAARALALNAGAGEATDLMAAEIGLKARHVLCQAIARQLMTSTTDIDARARVDEATDAVDDGLALARQWEQRGIDRFRGLAYDLARFGVRIYGAFQPHFLEEFVLENLDPTLSSGHYVGSAEMRAAAIESLWLMFRERHTIPGLPGHRGHPIA